jgi:NADPH:quinone reductase-like Zn-dependent oxidoreductase
MKRFRFKQIGAPLSLSVLTLEDAPTPTPGDYEVLVRMLLALKSGDTLLQSAAGSVVGQLVLQIAKANGFRTINLVRRPEQAREVSALGGHVVSLETALREAESTQREGKPLLDFTTVDSRCGFDGLAANAQMVR